MRGSQEGRARECFGGGCSREWGRLQWKFQGTQGQSLTALRYIASTEAVDVPKAG